MAPKLRPGEQVIFEGRPSWRALLGFYIQGVALIAAAAVIVYTVTSLGDGGADVGLTVATLVIGAAITVVVGFVKRVATSYTITNRRLHIKRGIVSREIQETRLERVQNVNYHQSVLQRALQVGDVDFDTAAGDDYNFIFAGVAEPEDIVDSVHRATTAAGDGLGDEQTERL